MNDLYVALFMVTLAVPVAMMGVGIAVVALLTLSTKALRRFNRP